MKFLFRRKTLLCLFSFLFSFSVANTQENAKEDTVSKPSASGSLKPYKDVITNNAVTSRGFFKVHKVDDRYYFEIPKSLLGRQLLSVGRIAEAPVDPKMLSSRASFGTHSTGYAGDKITQNVIEFETGPKNKVYIKVKLYFEKANDSSENGLSRALKNNNMAPSVASLDVKAFTPDSSALIVDFTDFINSDNSVFYFVSFFKKEFGITTIVADRSFTRDVKAFPTNIEIKTVKTYKAGDGFITYGLNTNLILLPESQMTPRYSDNRVAYDVTTFTNFDINPTGIEDTRIISRWRLEPKAGELEKYKRGELVEPKQPIVIYIDPATPKKWVPWFIKGVNAWQKAFESAGFKNAIMAKEVTDAMTDFSIENSQYSAIVYKPSAVPDENEDFLTINPLTGEIIEAHIIWNHSTMETIYKKYLVQCGATDKDANTVVFNDELMGRLIEAEVSHKVGHALGLEHNRGASATVPVENLRNKSWVEENGIAPSIMDLVHYNYVAQPEDKIGREGLLPHIGDYDKWAIEFGYRLPQASTPEEEKPILNKWIIESIAANAFLNRKGAMSTDPSSVSYVVGDNLMKSGNYGIKNLKAILPHLENWTFEKGKGYRLLSTMYNEVFEQYLKYISAVTTYMGGLTSESKTVDQPGPSFTFIRKSEQKEALAYLNENFFTTPTWLFNKRYFELASQTQSENRFAQIQQIVLGYLLDNTRLLYMEFNPDLKEKYTAPEFLADMKKYLFAELSTHRPADAQRRMLQRQYIETLSKKIVPGSFDKRGDVKINTVISEYSDASIAIKMHFKDLARSIKSALPAITDSQTRYHMADLMDRINIAIKASME